MIKIRQYDHYRYTVVTPTDWGFDVSHPMPLFEAIQTSVGTFPKLLTPPPKQGGSKTFVKLHKRPIPPVSYEWKGYVDCDVNGCERVAQFEAGVETNINEFNIYVPMHNLCAECFVIWVQEYIASEGCIEYLTSSTVCYPESER